MEQRISIITLGVQDLQKSRGFYESLGWDIATEEAADCIVAFNLNACALALYPLDEWEEETGVKPETPLRPSFTLAYNVGSEAEVDDVITHAESMGATITKRPQKVFWGGYSGYFTDPDGYLWEVAYNPFSTPDSDGAFQWK